MAATPPFNCPELLVLLSERKIYLEEGPWVTGGEGKGGEGRGDGWGEELTELKEKCYCKVETGKPNVGGRRGMGKEKEVRAQNEK